MKHTSVYIQPRSQDNVLLSDIQTDCILEKKNFCYDVILYNLNKKVKNLCNTHGWGI